MTSKPKGRDAVRWVGQDHRTGLPFKRKQAPKACAKCRKSKKRCSHLPISAAEGLSFLSDTPGRDSSRISVSTPKASQIFLEASNPSPGRPASPILGSPPSDLAVSNAASQFLRIHEEDHVPDSGPQTKGSSDEASPFIGELNPEGIFIEATLARSARGSIISPDKEVITSPGIWINGNSRRAGLLLANFNNPRSRPKEASNRSAEKGLSVTADDLDSFTTIAQSLIVAEHGALIQATDRAWDSMKNIYLGKINPILPVFDEPLLAGPRNGSLVRRLMEASVCLAAASDPDAAPHLILHKQAGADHRRHANRVSYHEYSQAVVDFIQAGVVELRTNEPQEHVLDCVSVLALTSLFWQPGPHARFSPMDSFAMLASMAHTYGIHLMGTDGARAPFRNNDSKRPNRLFRCLYAIDRLISAFFARPVLFHNYDILISLKPHDGDTPSFKLFMALITNLDQIIELYRPRPTIQQCDIDFPVFERLIMQAGAQHQPDHILGTLEVLYHAISILSVRMPRDRFRSAPEDDDLLGCVSYSHLPPNRANARRSLSADRIVETIRDYKLSPMPFIPYALALSLSVQYRKWRFSRTPMFRARAKKAFQKILPILDGLGRVWTSARVTSSLGEEVVKKLSCSKLADPRTNKPRDERDEMDLDVSSGAADQGRGVVGQITVPQAPSQIIGPPAREPADLPTPATSDDATARPALLQLELRSDAQLNTDDIGANTSQLPDETAAFDFSVALEGFDEEGLADFDWTLANTLDPCYSASSYYWSPFQGAGEVGEALSSSSLRDVARSSSNVSFGASMASENMHVHDVDETS